MPLDAYALLARYQATPSTAFYATPNNNYSLMHISGIRIMQDVLQQRWDATEEMLAAEAQVEEMQQEVDHLLSRMPRCWRHQLQEQQPQQQQNGSAASCSTA